MANHAGVYGRKEHNRREFNAEEFGAFVKSRREHEGWTQRQLAYIIGEDQATVHRIESAVYANPGIRVVLKLMSVFCGGDYNQFLISKWQTGMEHRLREFVR